MGLLIWKYSARASFEWIKTWQGQDGFQETFASLYFGRQVASALEGEGILKAGRAWEGGHDDDDDVDVDDNDDDDDHHPIIIIIIIIIMKKKMMAQLIIA